MLLSVVYLKFILQNIFPTMKLSDLTSLICYQLRNTRKKLFLVFAAVDFDLEKFGPERAFSSLGDRVVGVSGANCNTASTDDSAATSLFTTLQFTRKNGPGSCVMSCGEIFLASLYDCGDNRRYAFYFYLHWNTLFG